MQRQVLVMIPSGKLQLFCLLAAMLCGACSSGASVEQGGRWSDAPTETARVESAERDLNAAMTTAADSVLAAVNVRRALGGVPPLIQQPVLSEVARERSIDMAASGYLGHVNPQDGQVSVEALLGSAGVIGQAAELLYQSTLTIDQISQQAVAAWFQDSDHNLILLSPDFRFAGVGVMGDGERWILTLILSGEAPKELP